MSIHNATVGARDAGLDSRAPSFSLAALRDSVARRFAAWRAARRQASDFARLAQFDTRLLLDIGLSHSDIAEIRRHHPYASRTDSLL